MQPGHRVNSSVLSHLHCKYYNNARISLLNDVNAIDRALLNSSDSSLVNALLYGVLSLITLKTFILNSGIKYILISEIFSGRLF